MATSELMLTAALPAVYVLPIAIRTLDKWTDSSTAFDHQRIAHRRHKAA